MKTLILAVAVFGIGIGTAYAGDGGDFPMPPPASSQVAPGVGLAPKTSTPVLHAFVARHSTTTSLFPPTQLGGGAHD